MLSLLVRIHAAIGRRIGLAGAGCDDKRLSTRLFRNVTCAALIGLTWGVPTFVECRARGATFGLGKTSRAARQEALRAIPFRELTPTMQQRIAAVVSNPSVYRRLPLQVIDCEPSLYLFLVRHPEVVVNIWELMGVTQIQLQRTGPFTFAASDGMGTKSNVELVYGTNDVHLVYGEGTYDGPLLRKPVRGRCVLLLRSGFVRTAEGRVHVTNCLDVFLQMDRVAMDVIAKTIHPLFGKVADNNFSETVGFLERVSRTAERNGPGMQRLASRLTKVDEPTRQRFAQLAGAVHSGPMPATMLPSDVSKRDAPGMDVTTVQ